MATYDNDKRLDDFYTIVDNLKSGGQGSRAEAMLWLIDTIKRERKEHVAEMFELRTSLQRELSSLREEIEHSRQSIAKGIALLE